jgi:hypothetical protein
VTTTSALTPQWPVTFLQPVVTVLALVLALVTLALVLLDRRLPRWVLGLVVGVEVVVVALAAQCLVAWAQGTAPLDPVVFLSYLAVVLVAPLGSWWWAKDEPSRWGPGVVCVAALVLPVLVIRLEQVWTGRG